LEVVVVPDFGGRFVEPPDVSANTRTATAIAATTMAMTVLRGNRRRGSTDPN
jgi:hypothetical protein